MVIIDCEDPVLRLRLPPCAADVEAATLSRAHCPTYDLTAAIVDGDLHLSGVPPDPRRGVWALNLQTNCGCFEADVFMDYCRAPGFIPTHHDDLHQEPIIQCCVPDLIWPPTLGFTGPDGDLLEPSPPLSEFSVTPSDDSFTVSLTPIPAGFTHWRLLDHEGRPVATGELPHIESPIPIRCSTFYLVLTDGDNQ